MNYLVELCSKIIGIDRFYSGVDGLVESAQSFTSTQIRELDIDDTLLSTTGSKSLQEAFCKHEDMLLSK